MTGTQQPSTADRIADALDEIKNQKPTLWRVDVAGYTVLVHGEKGYEHLLKVNRQLATARLALHRIKRAGAGNYEGNLAEVALQEMDDA